MKIQILHKYLIKELFRTFLPSLLCFEFVLLLGFSIQLLHKGLDVPSLFSVLPYMALYTIPHALPTSLLTATVMSYGRLSADNEITAIKVAGIHLHNLVTPVIIVGVFFSILTLYLNAEVLPKSYFKVRQLQEKAVKRVLATHFITAKKKIDFPPYQIFIGAVESSNFKDIAVFEFAGEIIVSVLLAEEGEIEIDDDVSQVFLTLRRGEFLKPDSGNSVDSPTTGSFEEAVFKIPLSREVRHSALKYTTLTDLLGQRKEINNELSRFGRLPKDPEKTIERAKSGISSIDDKKNVVEAKLQKAEKEIKRSEGKISKQEGTIKRGKFNLNVYENYINVAKGNIENLTREEESVDNIISNWTPFGDTLERKHEREKEFEKNISLIKKIIEKDKRRIKSTKRKILISQRLIDEANGKIEKLTLEVGELNRSMKDLQKEHAIFTEQIAISGKQKMKRELSINIHKRLSPSLASLTFILIGIPLGIMTRSSNMLVSVGISFILILFIYYPLVATGLVVAESMGFPIIPSVWGANVVNLIISALLFRKIMKL
ncbi:MAG: LptF/LptG family permease [Candidatus Scalindua rubra]|uniref:Putative transporter protein n=1 Tax=Candidatus Scalindua brodae TaxID=237368 RepID=A0A0B0ECA5_9BACT|nr:MAG: putative transporter protein [Candidatus Scalindua brodae]MBZ0110228.1 LptF/LptG family permease [Candidatus Scalindua rubra]TWU29010.1 putative permease YjgP/YjgQ family protein [Candidatus Brocadiaceae bacterium S225]